MQGFMIDAPNVLIQGKKNTYATITAASGSVELTGESLEITGGWSPYALISIPTTSSLTVNLTDAQLTDGYFEVGVGAEKTNEQSDRYYFDTPYEVDDVDYTITIDKEVDVESIRINGLTKVSTEPQTGEFKAETTTGTTTITFNEDMAGKMVTPIFSVKEASENYIITTDSIPSKGKAVLVFPVYTNEGDDATIAAYCQITIFEVSVTQQATIGGSYKTASTFGMTLRTVTPRRADKKVWQVDFYDAA